MLSSLLCDLKYYSDVSECPTIDYITYNSLITLTFLSTFHSLGIGQRKVIIKGWCIFPFKAAKNPHICLSGSGFTTVNTIHLRDTLSAEEEQRTTQQRTVLNFWPKLRKYFDSFSCSLRYTGKIILQPSSVLSKIRRPASLISFSTSTNRTFTSFKTVWCPPRPARVFSWRAKEGHGHLPPNLRPALFSWNSVIHHLTLSKSVNQVRLTSGQRLVLYVC